MHVLSSTQVYNLTTYPNLTGLLDALGVDTEPSDMSFGLSIDGGALEWGSRGLGAVFAQRGNLLSPSFWRMLWDVIRFGKGAPEVRRHTAPLSEERLAV
jgi:predicted NAD/FAD-binding protein